MTIKYSKKDQEKLKKLQTEYKKITDTYNKERESIFKEGKAIKNKYTDNKVIGKSDKLIFGAVCLLANIIIPVEEFIISPINTFFENIINYVKYEKYKIPFDFWSAIKESTTNKDLRENVKKYISLNTKEV